MPPPTAPTPSSSPTARSSPPTPAPIDIYDARVGGGYPVPPSRDPLLRRRLPAAAARTRRPDSRHPALESLRQPADARAEEAAEVQEGPGQEVRQVREEEEHKHEEAEGSPMRAASRNRRSLAIVRPGARRALAGARRRPGRLRLPPRRRRLRRHRDRRRRRANPRPWPAPIPTRWSPTVNFNKVGELLRRRPQGPRPRPAAGPDRKPDRGATSASPAQFATPRDSPFEASLSGESCPATSPDRDRHPADLPRRRRNQDLRRLQPRAAAGLPLAVRLRPLRRAGHDHPARAGSRQRIRPHPAS